MKYLHNIVTDNEQACADEITNLRTDNARLKGALEQAQEKVNGLREDYRMLRGYADTIEEQRDAARAELATLQTTLAEVVGDREATYEALTALQQRFDYTDIVLKEVVLYADRRLHDLQALLAPPHEDRKSVV